MRVAITILILVTVVGLAGCGEQIRAGVENAVARELTQVIGPAEDYDVQISGPAYAIANGKIEGVSITGRNVQLDTGLTLSNLNVQVNNLVVNPETREIISAGGTQFAAGIAEPVIQNYARERYPNIPGLAVELRDDYLTIRAQPNVAGVRATIEADAGLEIRNQKALAVDLRDVRTAGISAPGFAREYIEDRIPVLFDASAIGFDAQIENVDISPNALGVSGSLDLVSAVKRVQRQR